MDIVIVVGVFAIALGIVYASIVAAENIERWWEVPGYMRRWGIRRR